MAVAGIGLQFATGYTVAFLVYQIGTLVTTGSLGTGFVPVSFVVAAIAAFPGLPDSRSRQVPSRPPLQSQRRKEPEILQKGSRLL